MPKRNDDLRIPGEPAQQTRTGLRISIPTRRAFFGSLKKAAKGKPKPARRKKASR